MKASGVALAVAAVLALAMMPMASAQFGANAGWMMNMGQAFGQSPWSLGSGGLTNLGQGLANPLQFGQQWGDQFGSSKSSKGNGKDQFGQPFDEVVGHSSGPGRKSQAEKEAQLKELQDALQGDPSVAAVVGPALLLASSISLTVAPSLATASTSIGIASAIIGNIVQWTEILNNLNIFLNSFLGHHHHHRSLLEANGTDVNYYRAQVYKQMQQATSDLKAWGGQLQKVRAAMGSGPFQSFLNSQIAALQTARKSIAAVGQHPVGRALGLGNYKAGPLLSDVAAAAGNIGGGAILKQFQAAMSNSG
ncbi:hypothetical protein HYH03_016929 [Edaphochlamys debaryana]|uniref:VP2 n=1 Tax=Edaphochlamys debaryana TaxID=47281 RepID=A0A836BPN7_9CHLO|nr:hypothetical protein HYH03_016929 [Edaphochlamys debaryana]|eukprot:KAG2484285.1 hypothetical protein HYH03_016929 [Edaphochlamys debaryana]